MAINLITMFSNYDGLIFSIFYFLTSFISIFVSYKINKIYKLSEYYSIRLFSFVFLYFGISFFIYSFIALSLEFKHNYIINLIYGFPYFLNILLIAFRFFSLLGVFMLIYSLIWKDSEKNTLINKKLLERLKILDSIDIRYFLIILISFFIAIISYYNPSLLFICMLVILIYTLFLSYENYKSIDKKQSKVIAQIYFMIIFIGFFAYVINFVLGFFTIIKIHLLIIQIVVVSALFSKILYLLRKI